MTFPSPAPSFMPRPRSWQLSWDTLTFKYNNGWFSWFKIRKGIGFCTIKGEDKALKPDAWKNPLLPKLLEEYSPDDIYNADETGLF